MYSLKILKFFWVTNAFFTDVQSFEHLDKSKKVSLFSRTRATVDYENNTNFFLGEYLSYTTKSGFGLTVQ